MDRERCDIFRVADRCNIRLFDRRLHSPRGRKARECYCKPTLRRIGRRYGEIHLIQTIRLIVETGNATELYAETISAVSAVVASGLVQVDGALFDAFDKINLGELRLWASVVKPGCSTGETMAAVLLHRFAGPDTLVSDA